MAKKVTVACAGVTQTHMLDTTGNYATLCRMDGDDPSPMVDQAVVDTPRNAKIDCPDCRAIWLRSREYKARNFATTHQEPTP